jgi:hypothetical protein
MTLFKKAELLTIDGVGVSLNPSCASLAMFNIMISLTLTNSSVSTLQTPFEANARPQRSMHIGRKVCCLERITIARLKEIVWIGRKANSSDRLVKGQT